MAKLRGSTVSHVAPLSIRPSLSRTLIADPDAAALTFIMLNPSAADEMRDDPTLRRCIGFARREGAGRLSVINLFIWRTSKPHDLWRMVGDGEPAGVVAGTLAALDDAFAKAGLRDRIICAWGSAAGAPASARTLWQARIEAVFDLARRHRRSLHCLGRNADSSPRHPLYVRADQPLQPFDPGQ